MIYTNEVHCPVDFYIKKWPAVFGVMKEHCWTNQETSQTVSISSSNYTFLFHDTAFTL